MDEVFGEDNLLMRLSGVTRVQPIKKIISQRNMTLCFLYAKTKDYVFNGDNIREGLI